MRTHTHIHKINTNSLSSHETWLEKHLHPEQHRIPLCRVLYLCTYFRNLAKSIYLGSCFWLISRKLACVNVHIIHYKHETGSENYLIKLYLIQEATTTRRRKKNTIIISTTISNTFRYIRESISFNNQLISNYLCLYPKKYGCDLWRRESQPEVFRDFYYYWLLLCKILVVTWLKFIEVARTDKHWQLIIIIGNLYVSFILSCKQVHIIGATTHGWISKTLH